MSNPRYYETRSPAKLTRRLIGRASRKTALLTLFLIPLATMVYSSSSASSSLNSPGSAATARHEDRLATRSIKESSRREVAGSAAGLAAGLMPLMPQELYSPETVTTYAADCTTPKSAFTFGEMVCAKIEGGPELEFAPRRFAWVATDNVIHSRTTVTQLGQTDLFQIPAADPNNDLRGGWRVNSISLRSSVRASAVFTVSDPVNAAANLSIYDNLNTNPSGFIGGSNVEFVLWVVNRGPDNAANVQIAIAGTNSTFASYIVAGEAFTCLQSGATCSISNLAAGTKTAIKLVYNTDGNDPVGTVVTNTATITSDTNDARPGDNSSAAKLEIQVDGDAGNCELDCPDNITRVADAMQGEISGSFVTLASADVVGNCGAVTSDRASESFFPVGTTTVTVTSASGQSCTYTVTVIDTPAPAITCPADQTITSCAAVNPGTPGATGTGVTVQGIRSDGRALTDPYPDGNTTITWTATDSSGRTATCDQTITTNVTDTTAPVPDVNALPTITSACTATAEVPTATDDCSGRIGGATTDSRSYDSPGTYTIQWTYTDAAGNSSTQDQTVVVTADTAAPTITQFASNVTITADASSCPTMPDLTGEINATDNCSTFSVTQSPAPGTTLSPGNTTVTFTVADTANNSTTSTAVVTFVDNIAPTITAPDDASYQCATEVPAINAGAASAADNCGATVSVSESRNGGAGSPASPLVITRTFTATDAANNSASDSQVITVTDTTAPTLTVVAPAPASADASCHAVIPDVTSSSTATDNCGGAVTLGQSPAAGTSVGLGTHQIVVTATDAWGNSSTANTNFAVNDTTAPAITAPDVVVYLPLNSTATSKVVTYAPTAADNCSVPTVTTDIASGSVFPVGTTTVQVTAVDAANNQSVDSFTVTVSYNFTGFFQPVDNLPTLNSVNAGRAIPVKFSLSGNKGLNIFAAGSPYTIALDCGSGAEIDVEETVTAGGSSLSYQSTSDQYHYVWKTENSWAGTCRQLVVTLNDGSEHRANFKFR